MVHHVALELAIAVTLALAAPEAGPAQGIADAKGGGARPRPRITDEEIADLKSKNYEVTRVDVKYQPYIIDYKGEELPQLCYDTRKEAQARVDEIKHEDRLDKLGVEGRQHKKVDIREDRRSTTETVFGNQLGDLAKNLAKEKRYKADGDTTHCNSFVRDFARELLNRSLPELSGLAKEQLTQLKTAAEQPDSPWRSLAFGDDPAHAFQTAQDLANAGKLVVVAIPGHVAVVVPTREGDSDLVFSAKSKEGDKGWGMNVPHIAQAGKTVSGYMPLSQGFGPSAKSGMEIFVLSP